MASFYFDQKVYNLSFTYLDTHYWVYDTASYAWRELFSISILGRAF